MYLKQTSSNTSKCNNFQWKYKCLGRFLPSFLRSQSGHCSLIFTCIVGITGKFLNINNDIINHDKKYDNILKYIYCLNDYGNYQTYAYFSIFRENIYFANNKFSEYYSV